MSLTFLHTADWQIGKPFTRFESETAALLREARIDAIDTLANLARTHGAAHVLVGGDIYDAETVSQRTIRQPLEVIRRHTDVTWHLLPGNHDFARRGGLWDRVTALGVPENVRLHLEPGAIEIASRVWLLPAPLRSKVLAGDPTEWMDEAETPDGDLRIGLAHGSVGRFGSDHGASVPISPDRAENAGLGYLALGDYHGMLRVGPRTWYSGTPEPDGWKDNDPGHALVVRLEDARAEPTVTPVASGRYVWFGLERPVSGAHDVAGLDAEVGARAGNPRNALVRVTLTGDVSLAAHEAIREALTRLSARVRHLEEDLSGLRAASGAEDLALFDASDELRHVAQRLQAMAQDAGHPRRDAAELALIRLFHIVSEERVQ